MARLARRSSVSEDGFEQPSSLRTTRREARLPLANNRTSQSPSASASSDKENYETPLRSNGEPNGKLNAMLHKLPTAEAGTPQSNKRRRLGERSVPVSQVAFRKELDELDNTEYYDPDQSMEQRRETRKEYRDTGKILIDQRGDLLLPESTGLIEVVTKANKLFENVKQTSDATLDSRILTSAADLAARRAAQMSFGDRTQAIDVDNFIGKCISFMRRGPSDSEAALADTSTRRRRQARDYSDDGDSAVEESADEGDAFNWEWLGRKACFPNNLRPPVPGFLLGPLSVQKKVRKQTQRRERLQKRDPRDAVRPEELKVKDIERVENANLTTLCRNIYVQLWDEREKRMRKAEEEVTDDDTDETRLKIYRGNGIHDDGGLPFFNTVINPLSFGQSVENLFYISFLIRDGKMSVTTDSMGLPSLTPINIEKLSSTENADPKNSSSKHQAVFHLDYEMWEKIIETFEIKQCIIPHRNSSEGTQISTSGWYA